MMKDPSVKKVLSVVMAVPVAISLFPIPFAVPLGLALDLFDKPGIWPVVVFWWVWSVVGMWYFYKIEK